VSEKHFVNHACPLCDCEVTEFYYQDKKRSYQQCSRCALVFVAKPFHLTPLQEKAEYDKHENSVDDIGYRSFLARLTEPLIKQLAEGSKGLDFGCGSGPALMAMLEEKGFAMQGYDVYYRNDQSVLNTSYDFITMTEVIEHLAKPKAVLEQLLALLNTAGKLGIMTKLVIDKEAFSHWHYKNDPTHIAFYSLETFAYFAEYYQLEFQQVANDAFIFSRR
jgi:2-polyprenyl-3-methyl-5-hydroxy-6-metoxy-1,4-benzoquinol methylase